MQQENLESIAKSRKDDIMRYRRAITNFTTLAKAAIISGEVRLGELYKSYERMKPCIHRKFGNEKVVDLVALSYALQRLPEEISQTQELYIKNNLEDLTDVPGIKTLKTKGRRRIAYMIDDSYMHMIAREGETDIFDIMTSMIMYSKEASKMKSMIREHKVAKEVSKLKDVKESEEKNKTLAKLANKFCVDFQQLKNVDQSLDYRLFSIIDNLANQSPQNMAIRFDNEFSITEASTKAEEWMDNIEKELENYGERPVHLISSNTHGVVNCLTGFALEQKERILEEFGMEESDLENLNHLYCLTQTFAKKDKVFLKDKKEYEDELGITFLKDKFNTGIDVQIIDTAKLDYTKLDSRVKAKKRSKDCPIILNIDYAFGKEGKFIMMELCESLGKRIESISITGKAGIVCGNRYDIMLPTAIIPQIEGGIYHFPSHNNCLKKENFKNLNNGIKVHSGGPMLTVPGTAIQNDLVLYDYMYRYGILGLEMEAAPYFDSIEKARERKQLRKDIKINVGYWGSDNPLDTSQSLAETHMDKGFQPTYAIIVGILNNVMGAKNGKS